MMNMYRETECNNNSPKDIAKGVKRSVKTSALYRLAVLKKVEKAIIKTSVEDFESLKSIENLINRFDLEDDRFGPSIKKDLVEMFNRKMAESQDMVDRNLTQV